MHTADSFKQSVCTQRTQFVIHFCTHSSSQYAHNGHSLLFISVQSVQVVSMHTTDTVCYSFLHSFKQSVCIQRTQFVIHFCTVSSSQYAHNGHSLLFISVQFQAVSMHTTDTVCYSFLYSFKQSVCTQRTQFVIHFCTVSSSQYAHSGHILLFISVQFQVVSMHIADTVCYSFLYSFK